MNHPGYWQQLQQAYQARAIVWLVAALLIAAVIWAALSTLDEVVVGEGKVVPSQSVQKIQSFEGGIVKVIYVTEGQRVKVGELLAGLDDTRFRSAFQEAKAQRSALFALKTRLKAELSSVQVDENEQDWHQAILVDPVEIVWQDDNSGSRQSMAHYSERIDQLESQLKLAAQQIFQFERAVESYKSTFDTLTLSQKLAEKELRLTRESAQLGAVAEVEVIQLERESVQLRGDIVNAQLSEQRAVAERNEAIAHRFGLAIEFRARAQARLDELEGEMAQLDESMTALADRLKRTQVVSPVEGVVKDIAIRSVGGVVSPGEAMMEIVPLGDNLIVETRIAPKDIAFVRQGLGAMVKFTAFDYVVYGGLKGQVVHVSADALQDEDGTTYYRAHILTHTNEIQHQPIIPGMQASVDIMTGQKTVLSYLMKPILRAKATALREP
ncbi:HlyD family type I secretion periplasmic adaptor subunit [Echinimonas agarilytica]|uniref:Membrane fusion protein (MFP) family protein n=1 Tax=Echinimonas agarilytica TaxID=1215918 RepID=A0AA41W4W6_9GAMM|nr:HlyD family type I secretion periplasmic adaptor subunit [Echinimonas agarilytica]MCM2679032.1 HlyD family type I secretion periplasmic adaptor subunit [Echinimonas agarilytica]